MERYNIVSTPDFKEIIVLNTQRKAKTKVLTQRIKNKGGRSSGSIVAPRRGEFKRRIYRKIDLKRTLLPNQKGIYIQPLYDPNRSGGIGMICYPIGIMSYILKPTKLNPGDIITNMMKTDIYYGDAAPLANFGSGILVYNINGKYIRSAGCSAILVRKDGGHALLKMKSGELRYFREEMMATSGTVSNEDHFLRDYKKAGVIRYLGKRPRVRPASMNPVDHPMGGRTRGGSFPKNPKGLLTLNIPTVKKHNPTILYTKRQIKILKTIK